MLKSLIKNRAGNIALLSAFALPVITLGVIYAVDYGLYIQTRQDISSAARTAALSAANEAHIAYADQEDVDFEALIEQHAKDTFEALTGDIRRVEYANIVELKVTPIVDNNKFSVHVGYDAQYASIAPGITSKNVYHITNKSRATVSSLAYVNINLVFDVSASMGVGATEDDMEIVTDVANCAFACHIGASADKDSTYDLARAAGANMRIDVARDAAIAAVDAVEDVLELEDQVSFGLYRYDSSPETILDPDDEDATDFDKVRSLINAEIFMNTIGGGTNLEYALQHIAASLPPNGSGRTPDDRIQHIVVLTDGVEDGVTYLATGGSARNPNSVVNSPSYRQKPSRPFVSYAPASTHCTPLTDDGTNIYFIHTEYLIPTTGDIGIGAALHFKHIKNTLNGIIPDRFEDCTGNVHNILSASSPDEIETAFSRLLKELSSPLRVF